MIDSSMISKYLTHLDEQGNNLTTRNLRLNCIKAFYSYAAQVNKEAVAFNEVISKIPKASVPQYRKVDWQTDMSRKNYPIKECTTFAGGLNF